MISPELVAALRAKAEGLLPDTAEALDPSDEVNDLGEPVGGYVQTGVTAPCRLGDENGSYRFVARPIDSEDLTLSLPVGAAAGNAEAFLVNGSVLVERAGPDRNALNSLRTVRRIPVRRVSPGTPALETGS